MSGLTVKAVIPPQTKSQQWEALVVEQQGSGETVSEFCKERGVNHHTFRYWQAKLLRGQIAECSGRFVSVAKPADFSTWSAKIILPNGVQIDLGAGLESTPVARMIFQKPHEYLQYNQIW